MKPIRMTFDPQWTIELQDQIKQLKRRPRLLIFNANQDDVGTQIYLKNKLKYANQLGIDVKVKTPQDRDELFDMLMDQFCKQDQASTAQLMFQRPADHQMLSMFLNQLNQWDLTLDVEGVTERNQMRLRQAAIHGKLPSDLILPCTTAGNFKLIDTWLPGFAYEGKIVLVVGRSEITGTPAADVFEALNCTVIKANSHTYNLDELAKIADVIVSCAGVPNLIHECKDGAVLIDNGVTFVDGHQQGDIARDCRQHALAYTPYVNATGKATVHCLFENLVKNEIKIESEEIENA